MPQTFAREPESNPPRLVCPVTNRTIAPHEKDLILIRINGTEMLAKKGPTLSRLSPAMEELRRQKPGIKEVPGLFRKRRGGEDPRVSTVLELDVTAQSIHTDTLALAFRATGLTEHIKPKMPTASAR